MTIVIAFSKEFLNFWEIQCPLDDQPIGSGRFLSELMEKIFFTKRKEIKIQIFLFCEFN
jgi:hypothetical protein